jgi:sugar lactone lactonase YvrE
MNFRLETIAKGLGFVEGLRWWQERLWFSDFGARRVWSIGRDRQLREEAYVPAQPSGLGFDAEGRMLIVSTHDGRVLRRQKGGDIILADIGASYRGGLNDMLTHPSGHSYVSAFAPPLIGEPSPDVPPDGGRVPVFLVSASGETRIVAEGLKTPNGMAFTADGRELLVAESLGNRVSAFPILADDGLGERRTFVDLEHRSPDGLCMDGSGHLWVGCPFTSEFARLAGDGSIDGIITLPGRWTITCAVGASDEELWLGAVETTIADYKAGRSRGEILRCVLS